MKERNEIKVYIQSFGRFLSGMVMPNIGAFIAWGIATALFIPTGWFPNESLNKLISPMLIYLLPLLIGYTGGKLIAGERGGVMGAITTAGVIVGSTIPMFLGAMIAGPIGGYVIKKFDKLVNGKIKSGFEMLINNFSIGILGITLSIIFYKAIGPFVEVMSQLLGEGVNKLVEYKLLPLTSLIVEPAKVLFLNNAINHGIFSPLGIQQVSKAGKSIFFLIESNPGPGLGVLLAYMIFGEKNTKKSASGAAIIQFFGGIHEIYFPYILMNPFLLMSVILGGVSGMFVNVLLDSGLVAPPSPGSIFAIIALAPKGGVLKVLCSVFAATMVSFVVASIILKKSKKITSLEEAQTKVKNLKINKKLDLNKQISKIVVACDAGMGSSAMGASILKRKIKEAKLSIDVTNRAISDLTEDIDIVITHKDLTSRAKKIVSKPVHLSIDNFMDGSFYDALVTEIKCNSNDNISQNNLETDESKLKYSMEKENILNRNSIVIGRKTVKKEEALREVGEYMAKLGYVKKDYINYILEREKQSTTYLGNYVAIPHGTTEGKKEILKTGIVIFQYPDGIDFGEGNKAYFLVGIAGKNNEHIEIISHLSEVIDEEEEVLRLKDEQDIDKLYKIFSF